MAELVRSAACAAPATALRRFARASPRNFTQESQDRNLRLLEPPPTPSFHETGAGRNVQLRVASSVCRALVPVLGCLPPAAAQESAPTVWTIAFSGIETDSRSTFASSGGKLSFALGPQAFSGFAQVITGSSVSDTIRANRGKIALSEVAMQGRLSFGLEHGFGPVFLSGGLGPSAARIARKGGGSFIRYGAFAHADLWYRPRAGSHLHLSLAADSAERSLWSRLRYGQRIAPLSLALGPELTASLTPTARKLRAGLHVSEITLWRLNLDLAGGVMWDRRGFGQYLTLSSWMKY